MLRITYNPRRRANINMDYRDYLSKQPLTPATGGSRIIYVNVVVLRGNWFLNKWFIEHNSIDLDVVLRLHQFMICKQLVLLLCILSISLISLRFGSGESLSNTAYRGISMPSLSSIE
jgi:hypothetical protein